MKESVTIISTVTLVLKTVNMRTIYIIMSSIFLVEPIKPKK
jgi:hypothetical protein